mgnify:CR=1 FL=1
MKLSRFMAILILVAILGTSVLACAQPSAPAAPAKTPPAASTPAAATSVTPIQTSTPTPEPAKTATPESATAAPVGTVRSEERTFSFTTVDFLGANSTSPRGINVGGDIVGQYVDASNISHGFALSKGKFSTIDFPGDLRSTIATAISPTGDIVGQYQLKSEPANMTHGYLLTKKGEWKPVDYPAGGPLMTGPFRILPDGTIIGCVHTDPLPGGMHGFSMGTQGLSLFDQPSSMHMGATPDGKTFVGYYTATNTTGGYGTGAITRGYVLDKGRFIPFDAPNSKLTQAMDVNSARVVAGLYTDLAGKIHGFMVEARNSVVADWQFTTIDYPGATLTRVFGIDDGGNIVGIYIDAAGKTHGFLANPSTKS